MKAYNPTLKRKIPIRLIKQCYDESTNTIDIIEFKQLCYNVLNSKEYFKAPVNKERYCNISNNVLMHCLRQCTIPREIKLCCNYMLRYMNKKGYALIPARLLKGMSKESAKLAARELRAARVLWSARNWYGWTMLLKQKGKYYSELPLDWFDWDGNYLYKSRLYVSSLEEDN